MSEDDKKSFIAASILIICILVLMMLSHHVGYEQALQDQREIVFEKIIKQMEYQNENT